MSKRIHVAVGVIYNPDRSKVLISKRTAKQHLAGLWEFPGGKVEKNEDVSAALIRELNEEIDINVEEVSKLSAISYDYPDKKVYLDVWQVNNWTGEPKAKENQQLEWVSIDQLSNYDFPDANKHIIQTLYLKPYYLISKSIYEDYSELLSTLEECFSAGLKLFQLRLENKDNDRLLIEKINNLPNRTNTKLILNGVPSDVEKFNIDGLHLKSSLLDDYDSRPISEEYILGASCHNQEELVLAKKLNVNYAFLSPVSKTSSHPEKQAIAWENFYTMSNTVDFPVYALGGMRSEDLKIAKQYNAYGIAMISGIWNSTLPVKGCF